MAQPSIFAFSSRNPFAVPLLISILIPLLVVLFCPVLYYSADDAMVVYTLSGQMGLPPQPWTDYDWGWHYLLGQGFAWLYTQDSSINWYGFFLAALLLLNGCLLSVWISKLLPAAQAAAYALLIYAGFLIPFWAQLNFSGVSFLTGLIAALWWMPLPGDGAKPARWWPMLLLLLGFSIRWHTTLLGLGLAAMGLLAFHPRRWIKYLVAAGIAVLMGYLLLWQHRLWCMAHVPGWAQDIGIRKALYAFYNLPTKPVSEMGILLPSTSHQQQYQNSFLLDSLRFNEGRLWQLAHRLHSQRWWWDLRAQKQLDWLFDVHKWLICIMLYLAAMLVIDSDKKGKRMAISLGALALALLFVLFTFFKLTHVLLSGISAAAACSLLVAKSRYPFKTRVYQLWVAAAIGLVCMGYYLHHFRTNNLAWKQQFACAVAAVPAHKKLLVTTQQFPFMGMPAFAAPAQYPIHQLFSPSQAGLAQRRQYLNQKSLHAWVLDTGVVLTGRLLDLPTYYKRKSGLRLRREWVNDSTGCLPQWRLMPDGLKPLYPPLF